MRLQHFSYSIGRKPTFFFTRVHGFTQNPIFDKYFIFNQDVHCEYKIDFLFQILPSVLFFLRETFCLHFTHGSNDSTGEYKFL